MSIFKSKLNKAKEAYEDMTLLVETCNNPKYDYLGYWETFWELSGKESQILNNIFGK